MAALIHMAQSDTNTNEKRSMPTLPPEILENVVEFCSSDKTTLHALSLVSTTWLPLARKQLFTDITLHPPRSNAFIAGSNVIRISSVNTRLTVMIPSGPRLLTDSPCAKFLAIIKASEQRRSRLGTFAPFVRHLHLCEGSGMSSWIALDDSLPQVLHAFSNLVSFSLSRSGHMPIIWAGIPFTLRNAIVRLLSQSTLVEVRLSGLVFRCLKQVNSLLGSCRGLRTLDVCHSGVQEEGELEAETGGSVEKATLDTLILGPFTPILFVRSLLHPSCSMRVNTVRKLCLCIPGNFSDFARILHASTSLDTLELVLTNPCEQFLSSLKTIGNAYTNYIQWSFRNTGHHPLLNNLTYQSSPPCVIFESRLICFKT
jgi:hypothetical protein